MIYLQCSVAAVLVLGGLADNLHGRLWTDSTGHYAIEADLVAFNDDTVVLQRADHELVAVPINKLSADDQEFLKSKEAGKLATDAASATQTWTMADGTKIVGRVVDYARRDLTIQRRRGKIFVNDRLFENLPEIYQRMVPKIVAHFENLQFADVEGLTSWLVRQKGQPRTFQLEGVVMELENGDEYGFPFFFFSPEDLQVLKPGWDEWLAAHEDYERRNNQAFLLQSAAAARQRDAEVEREIAMMQLNLQAVETGLTSVWEVTLYPATGNGGPPMWVVEYGRNSREATAKALQTYPAYVAGPVRKVSGNF